ncbi:hypothetical protein GIS00_11815 [Nakamurella sp. YIM 132087]|uniref:Uncharacterized protein n=1 Tax=Nakamurella alba TaxID=2665158 RepID=A0A7K1FMT0_9ACTN|nr:hypothetical protein [Nakamurella alba]MTD14629.1 hypothetical protein [Nakamurella alba]
MIRTVVVGPPNGARLHIDIDLDVTVDGVDAHVTTVGSELRVRTRQPVRLLRAVRSSLPRELFAGRVATGMRDLIDSDTTISFFGQRRRLASLSWAKAVRLVQWSGGGRDVRSAGVVVGAITLGAAWVLARKVRGRGH